MNKLGWLVIGLTAGAGAMLIAEAAVIASMPPELRYRPLQTIPEPVRKPIDLSPTKALVFEGYAEGWKDGVAFGPAPTFPRQSQWIPGPHDSFRADLPDHTVPEPGVLAMLAFPIAWLMWRKS